MNDKIHSQPTNNTISDISLEQSTSCLDGEIISSVPWVNSTPDSQIGRIVTGKVVPIPEGEFRGDPRHVLGHPSNPSVEIDFSKLYPHK
jgi:hypothetical protein